MKKTLFSIALLVCLSSQAFAEVILAPQWSEFCPTTYLSVPSTSKLKDKKYWYERRVQFEDSIERCSAYSGEDLKSCYAQVKEAELNKNKRWNAKVEQERAELEHFREINRRDSQYNLIRDVVKTISK